MVPKNNGNPQKERPELQKEDVNKKGNSNKRQRKKAVWGKKRETKRAKRSTGLSPGERNRP